MKYKYFNYLFLLSFFGLLLAIHPQPREYVLKTAFIEKFTRFTEWPEDILSTDTSRPFIVSVFGKSPIDNELDLFFEKQKIKDFNVEVRHIKNIDEIEGSQILFISESVGSKLSDILKYTKNSPILTIADTEGYAEKGVIINLYLEEDQIRFEINYDALTATDLSINYLLLNHARLIKKGGKK